MIIDNLLFMAERFILPLSVLLMCVLIHTVQSFNQLGIIKIHNILYIKERILLNKNPLLFVMFKK